MMGTKSACAGRQVDSVESSVMEYTEGTDKKSGIYFVLFYSKPPREHGQVGGRSWILQYCDTSRSRVRVRGSAMESV